MRPSTTRLNDTEIDPPRRLAFTWLWDEAAVRDHEGGWIKCFDNLERVLQEAHTGPA